MGIDMYVLVKARSRDFVDRFKKRWLTYAVPSRETYEFPMFADEKQVVYEEVDPLIDRLLREVNLPYGIYWNDYEGHVQNPMLFFTDDGGMIVGLTVREQGERTSEYYLDELKESVEGVCGLIVWETPPPLNQVEFTAWAEKDGVVF